MSEARFEPRSFLVVPSRFGRPKSVEWAAKDLNTESDWSDLNRAQQVRTTARMRAEFLAAQVQHRHSATIRGALNEWVLSDEHVASVRDVFTARGKLHAGAASKTQRYAALTGTSYDRLMKMLRGEIVMRLEDIAIADAILGTNLTGLRRNPPRG
jgi:hypothetical protein